MRVNLYGPNSPAQEIMTADQPGLANVFPKLYRLGALREQVAFLRVQSR